MIWVKNFAGNIKKNPVSRVLRNTISLPSGPRMQFDFSCGCQDRLGDLFLLGWSEEELNVRSHLWPVSQSPRLLPYTAT